MLLRHHWGRRDLARKVEAAVRNALAEGDHTSDVYTEGAISTDAFTQKVSNNLG